MKIIKPSIEIMTPIDRDQLLINLEIIGRTCYKSEDKITEGSARKFVTNLIKRGHEAMIEHESITVKVICDRGVSHEIVRHRIASYAQESTRYCNYSNDKFGGELTFIKPCFWQSGSAEDIAWYDCMEYVETMYLSMVNSGVPAQEARSILPNSLKTEIIITMNLREWRHFFKLRCAKEAHPQMREVANMLLLKFKNRIPVIFDDIQEVVNE